MKKIYLLIAMGGLVLWSKRTNAQVTIGANQAPDPSAILDIRATNKGVLFPLVPLTSTTVWSLAGVTPKEGMAVYNTNAAMGVGFYIWSGGVWKKLISSADVTGDNLGNHTATQRLNMSGFSIFGADSLIANKARLLATSSGASTDSILTINPVTGDIRRIAPANIVGTQAWSLLGNAGTNPATNFVGTTDAQALVVRTNNTEKMRVTSAGNVGIGTTTPKNKLSVSGGPISQDDFTDGDKYLLMGITGGAKITHNNGWIMGQYAGQITDQNGTAVSNQTGQFNWYTANNGVWAQRMTLSNAGNLSNTGTLQIGTLPSAAATDSVLTADASGNVRKRSSAALGDNLGNHTATQRLNMNNFSVYGADSLLAKNAQLNNLQAGAGTDNIVSIDGSGNLRKIPMSTISAAADTAMIAGANISITRSASGNTITATGDNLGNHTATQRLNMNNFSVFGADTLIANKARLLTTPSGAATDSILTINPATGDVRRIAPANIVGSQAWSLLGNTGTNPATNFLGTTDNQDVVVRTNNTEKMRVAANGLVSTTGAVKIGSIASAAATDSVLTADASGNVHKRTAASLGDNLGNHTATQRLNMNNFSVYGADTLIANKARLLTTPSGAATDSILSINPATGDVRKVTVASLGDNLGNHRATQTLHMANNNIDSIYNAKVLNDLQIFDRTPGYTNYFSIYKTGGQFNIWSSAKGANALTIDSATLKTTLIQAQITNLPSAAATDSILTADASGNVHKRTAASLGDNLGNHTATQRLNMNNFSVYGADSLIANKARLLTTPSGAATDSILSINTATGDVRKVTVASLGDNLGNHTATQRLNMNNFSVFGADSLIANKARLLVTPSGAATDSILTINPATGDVRRIAPANIVGSQAWSLLGNTGTNPATNFLGTTDNQDVVVRTNNTEKMRVAANGLVSTTGAVKIGSIASAAATDSVLTADASGNVHKRTAASLGDNLGNHTATQRLNMNNFSIYGADTLIANKARLLTTPSGAATDSILSVNPATGDVRKVTVASLGDNLGNHTATQRLNMTNHNIDSIAQANVLFQVAVYERTLADRTPYYALYNSNGSFGIWSYKGSSNRITIDSTGRVGVGTSSPKNKLGVTGGPIAQEDFANGDKYLMLGITGANKITHENGWVMGQYAGQITDQNGNAVSNQTGQFNWYTANNGVWAQRMTLSNAGNLSNTGTLQIGTIPVAPATDSILTADVNGNVHKMAQTSVASSTMNIVSTSAATYTPTATDNVIIVDATSNSVTVSIPAAIAATKGRTYTVKRIDNSANDVFIDFGTSHIDNATDTKLSVGNNVTIQFINLSTTQWYTISKF